MGAKVSTVLRGSGSARIRRGPPTNDVGPAAGRERRLDIHIFVSDPNHIVAGRAWERCVWRDARVLIAESPAPQLPSAIEAALQKVACTIAGDRGWEGMGTVSFSLDDRSGVFRVISAQPQSGFGEHAFNTEPVAGHALELRIDHCGLRLTPSTHLLVYGVTRGDALRRAFRALSEMPGPAGTDLAILMNRIASRAFCSGMTGTRLDQTEE